MQTQKFAISVFCDVIWAQNDVIKGAINFSLHWNKFIISPIDSNNDFRPRECSTTHLILSKLKIEHISDFDDVIRPKLTHNIFR